MADQNSNPKATKGVCFVVMPYGHTEDKIAWFAGWYIEQNITHIVEYIAAAERGDYYRPMDAVRRTASLDIAAVDVRSRDSVLKSLIQEVLTLRESIQRPESITAKKTKKSATHQSQIFHVIGSPQKRTDITKELESRGIPKNDFGQILTYSVPPDLLPSARTWDVRTWADYVAHRIKGVPFEQKHNVVPSIGKAPVSEPELDVLAKATEAPNTALEPTTAAPTVSDESGNTATGDSSTPVAIGGGLALDR